ncbi:MAG: InlB B-repeat-containing protein, partial [Clostridia bacterium]|nr:InlB B-repeat-containing protein [Clostridia bacterium]
KIYQPGDVCSVNDHITFTAIWTEKTYDVIYDSNGGVGSPSNAKKYYFSNYTISSATPLMEGYDFKEWSGSDGNTYNPGDVYSKNTGLTLSAVWTVKKFEITYDANGGDGGPESSYKEYFSDYVISPTIPSKEGNTFRYWRGSDGKTYYPGDTYSKNQALSLTAVWKLYSYEIIFDVNGGNEFFANEIKYFDVDFVIFSDIPTKEGYKFIGWQGSDGITYNGGDVYTGNSDLTLTAVWELKVYSIIYDANGGSNAPANGTKEHFLDFTISNTTPTLTGYDFVGWRGSDGKTYYPNDTYSTNANVVLTAIWQLKTFTLFYDANGGTVSSASKSVQYSKRIGTLETPKKTGYAFDGWYTEKTGGTKVTSESIVEGLNDFTVYAHWTAITYSVTFNANGGAVSVPGSTVTFDSAYGNLPTPTYKGYKFDGWYTEKDGGELVTAETIVKIASAHTLYARWKANVYLVSFDANGGECTPANAHVAYNSAYETLPVPTRNGYTFICWSKSKTEMDIVTKDTVHALTEDIVLFAIWDANVYTLSFDALGGKIDIDYKTVTFGSPYGLLPIPLYPNYIFGGWFLEKAYTNKVTSETIVSTADDHTVYAMWIPLSYTIVFDANGGEGAPEQQTKEYSVDLTLSDVEPIRKGFRFKGWSTTADGAVEYASGATYSENSNLTLYAVWEAISYGDPNGDGNINAMDAVLLAQKLAGWAVDIDDSAADVNGDGDINAKDAVLLAQFLAGWDVTLG